MLEQTINSKIFRFFKEENPPTPCLVVDLERVSAQHARIRKALPFADCHYAVKANPAPQVLQRLIAEGVHFDAASIYEIRQCLELGADPAKILFGNTIKKESEIAESYERGVRVFAFDSFAELDKLTRAAPKAKLLCRIRVGEKGAAWPLSKKFGCTEEVAAKLMAEAKARGLHPYGLSFHPGSQQTRPETYAEAIAIAAGASEKMKQLGIEIEALDLGGGFPAQYRHPIPTIETFGQVIGEALQNHFGSQLTKIIIEPGRFLVAETGVIRAEVVLVSYSKETGSTRWIYLDIGKFTGLTETEAIEYRIITERDGDGSNLGRVILAGPTCDSIDIIYEEAEYYLPESLRVGDKIYFLNAGAYTTTYSSVGFNGFPPLKAYYLE